MNAMSVGSRLSVAWLLSPHRLAAQWYRLLAIGHGSEAASSSERPPPAAVDQQNSV